MQLKSFKRGIQNKYAEKYMLILTLENVPLYTHF